MFPKTARKKARNPYLNHGEYSHAGVGLFREHFKSCPIFMHNWPRPQKWLQNSLFPPKTARARGTKKSIIPSQAKRILKNPRLK
ncbi:hypothetical protein [uncultured Desulfovibrio sp.]|uniref:hypothetical protein n=1 Tax=uncultured Desulfovibrio sp. TaxID=167968 RepID=UPI0025DC67DB|nr:hypothetical protein [uncultured Desulfovibrio sp.]